MSDGVKTTEPPVAWTIDVVREGPQKGRVRLRLWHGEHPPLPDATLIVSVEFPALAAQDLHTALGATLLENDDARDPEIPIPDDYPGQREATSADRRIPNDGELVEISLIPREMISGKTATLRLTLRSGTILHLRAKEEVRQNLQRDLVHRYQQEAYDLLVHDPTSPLYHHQ